MAMTKVRQTRPGYRNRCGPMPQKEEDNEINLRMFARFLRFPFFLVAGSNANQHVSLTPAKCKKS